MADSSPDEEKLVDRSSSQRFLSVNAPTLSFFPTFPILPPAHPGQWSTSFSVPPKVFSSPSAPSTTTHPSLGNQGLRFFPYSGYLGLTPIRVEGGPSFSSRITPDLTLFGLFSRAHKARCRPPDAPGHQPHNFDPLLRVSDRARQHPPVKHPCRSHSGPLVKVGRRRI